MEKTIVDKRQISCLLKRFTSTVGLSCLEDTLGLALGSSWSVIWYSFLDTCFSWFVIWYLFLISVQRLSNTFFHRCLSPYNTGWGLLASFVFLTMRLLETLDSWTRYKSNIYFYISLLDNARSQCIELKSGYEQTKNLWRWKINFAKVRKV